MKRYILGLLALGLLSCPLMGQTTISGPRVEARCEEDSIDTPKSLQRNAWAKRCGYISRRTWDFNVHDDDGSIRARPFYPSFSKKGDFDDWWKAPVVESAKCGLGPNNVYSFITNCRASCFTPDQEILFEEGSLTIFDAFSKRATNIVTLSDSATIDSLEYTIRPVEEYTESIRNVEHDILVIKTETGGQLKVTPNHPLLVSTGHMKLAEDLKKGDSLIHKSGNFDQIDSIELVKFYGKVYNVKPNSRDEKGTVKLNGQVIVAQGYLSGSIYYQNSGANFVNRLVLRDTIPSNLYN